MELPEYPSVSLHNVAETVPAEWDEEGDRLCRVPASVGAELNEMARDRVRHATGSEIRFVPESDAAEIEVTISAPDPMVPQVFWGPFKPWKPDEIGPGRETLTLSVPDRVADLTDDAETGRFDPRVCRIMLERIPPVAIHAVEGNCRPPEPGEVPETRYLAYGTSITEGADAWANHLTYVSRVARENDYDALNFGCSGSAYCEEAMAEYIASREDWDVATLSLSINMANTGGFSPQEFRDRAEPFVNTIAEARPEKQIACVTLFRYFDDVTESGDAERAAAYRENLRTIVAESPHDNLTVVEGPELMNPAGLDVDLLHPGDHGMEAIGEGLAERLAAVVK